MSREAEKKRLVKLIEEAHKKSAEVIHQLIMDTVKTKGRFNSKTDGDRQSIYEIEADYLLDNGVIVLPCKVGDNCYPLDASEREFTCEEKISRITISEKNIIIGYYEHWDYYNHCRKTDNWRLPLRTRILGKGVFLSEAEAKYALKNRRSVSLVNGHIEE